MHERVILVDSDNQDIGTAEKLEAHRTGQLHRAFSIFIFTSQRALLLQQRAPTKYHSGGLWTNTCCGHPRPHETTEQAAHRRLQEEMGFDCTLKEIFRFIYKIQFSPDLFEHEYDHVFIGFSDAPPHPDPREVAHWKHINQKTLEQDLELNGKAYTFWLNKLFTNNTFRNILAKELS